MGIVARELNLLCAGAVKGLVLALQDGFEKANGLRLHASFGAVGAMRDALRSGTPCDVFIASDAMIRSLQASGELRTDTQRAIGNVQTAVAVRASAPAPLVDSAESLKAALLGASAIYIPDTSLSTAGAHFAAILDRLGICAVLASRLRMFPNGATAMRELARADDGAIGCTQATEIRYTPGLTLVGALPPPFALATIYSAAVAAAARDDDSARRLIEVLTGASSSALRRAGGFDEVAGRDGA